MNDFSILGVKFSGKDKPEVLDYLTSRLEKKQKTLVFTPNPEIVLEAQKDKKFKEILNSADLNVADGIGLVYASGFLLGKKPVRIAGRQLMLDLLKVANQGKLKVFFLGASKEVNNLAVLKAEKEFPNIQVLGLSAPLLDRESHLASESDIFTYKEVLNSINKIKPDILFVALGAPKQEYWISKNSNLKAKIFMAVGGSLDYYVEKTVLPPSLISRVGLEWLWRGLQEPRRIKRIFKASVVFPLVVLKEKFFQKSV